MNDENVRMFVWDPDFQAESLMKSRGVEWEIIEVPISRINREWGENLARIDDDLDDKWVEHLAIAMENGNPMPMMILTPLSGTGPDRYGILGGNHRCAALIKLGIRTAKCYVVKVSKLNKKDVQEELPTLLNGYHGKVTKEEDAKQWAIRAVQFHGRSVADAARMYGLAKSTLATDIRRHEVENELRQTGLVQTKDLQKNVSLEKVGQIQLKSVRVKAGLLALKYSLGTDELTAMVNKVKRNNDDEEKMLKTLTGLEKDYQAEEVPGNPGMKEPRKHKMSKRSRFLRALHLLLAECEGKPRLEQFGLAPGDQTAKAKKDCLQLSNILRGYGS